LRPRSRAVTAPSRGRPGPGPGVAARAPPPPHAAPPCLLVQRAHERLADAGAPRARHDADAADPGVLPAQAEIREADRLAVAEGDPRGVEIEVEDAVHERKLLLVDMEREEIALVSGAEERRTFA